MGTINQRPLKGFVRFDGSGRVVAGSLILRRKMPKVGKWQEIPGYLCCNEPTFQCQSYSISVVRGETISYGYTDCYDQIVGPFELVGPESVIVCARIATVYIIGVGTAVAIGECVPPTTTTTTTTTVAPTTTTTTTTTVAPTTTTSTTTTTTTEPTTTTTSSTTTTTTSNLG